MPSAAELEILGLSLKVAFWGLAASLPFAIAVAFVLARKSFPGKTLFDAAVHLPLVLPPVVVGFVLLVLFGTQGPIGRLLEPLGISVAYTPIGVGVALTFIGIPFVVRTVQPVLEDFEPEIEEAAASLGASRLQIVRRVLLPALWPALVTGFALAFARAIGEYGSVVFISGNMPMKTEIAPLLIVTRLEQYDYAGATGIAMVMLAVSFLVLLAINLLQWWSGRRREA